MMIAVLTVVGLTSVHWLDLREGYNPYINLSPDTLPGLWARWDSYYYVSIAQQGYAPYNMGFFPLYPALMAGLSYVTGFSPALMGLFISQLSYLAAILGLYKLARLLQNNHAFAMHVVVTLLLFPSSFFFIAIYAESLSLAFSILAVYLVLRLRPLYPQAGLALAVASAARPVGWLLDIVLLAEFVKRRQFKLTAWLALGVGLVLSVSTVVLYVFYLYFLTGSFLAIPRAQAAWLRCWEYPWITLWKSISIALFGNGLTNDWFLYAINWVDLSFTGLALSLTGVAVYWSFKGRFNWSLSLYLEVSLLFLLAQQGVELVPLWGMTRWVAALFPLYLILGDLINHRVMRWIVPVVSASLLLFFTAWWTSGRWVG
ncbi:MAG: hypothetical protein JXM69_04390 [Anaerolineae bacterium]|nr:hypothetical protein [Anaerolineae bacterium]